ncbi:hypothetical protein BC830DRAFT_1145544 [Chytriomyces sp. MP71]|nr:hypothetical protein BC830DRAFT_1150053 [Chytriomyces sp. MP71]KAI8610494.1 hypothetical protein BC830DRAFT_1145544 [Chytriomyces sp. MP71]
MSSDPDTNMLSLGCELTSLGLNLNSPNPLYTSLSSIYTPPTAVAPPAAEGAATAGSGAAEPHYTLPACYRVPLHTADTAPEDALARASEDTLFLAFYALPRDRAQEAAAQELHSRGWRFHREIKCWVCRETAPAAAGADGAGAAGELGKPGGEVVVGERGVFVFFDPGQWGRVKKEWVVAADVLEERSWGPWAEGEGDVDRSQGTGETARRDEKNVEEKDDR